MKAKSQKPKAKSQKMQSMRATNGVPLCLSGITNPLSLSLSKEMADHERRRKAIKRHRSVARKGNHANQHTTVEEYADLDYVIILHDLFHTLLDFTAKAA
ncbi:hypothetical protein VNO78_05638 [Psophocarpus tetragonolobus]|uniref:Uncharacterized protein n=1 Tax=Psophocarpus tetragonolobus TaxID=3891 RepID=A0AAN9T116_PSOTE